MLLLRRAALKWGNTVLYYQWQCWHSTQCWKTFQKVVFNLASEASYVYNLSIIKQVNFNRAEIGGKCQNSKFKCDILPDFQTMLHCAVFANQQKMPQNHLFLFSRSLD